MKSAGLHGNVINTDLLTAFEAYDSYLCYLYI